MPKAAPRATKNFRPPGPIRWRGSNARNTHDAKATLLPYVVTGTSLDSGTEIIELCRAGMCALERGSGPDVEIDLFIGLLRRVAAYAAPTLGALMAKAELVRELLDDPLIEDIKLPPLSSAAGDLVMSLVNDILGRS